jgi:hypothetical protein
MLLLLDDVWFRVEVDVLPKDRVVETVVDGRPRRRSQIEPRFDVVLRRTISRATTTELAQCKYLYGSADLYAVSKRQISTREIKGYRLRRDKWNSAGYAAAACGPARAVALTARPTKKSG